MSEKKGLPIYLDEKERGLADITAASVEEDDWYPANRSATKIWRCLEALRDIENLVVGASNLSSSDQRRRAKIIVTPLKSFAESLQDTCNYILSAPEMKNQVEKGQKETLRDLLESFEHSVPLQRPSPMLSVRNKLSAHIDKRISPNDAVELFKEAPTHVIGTWLHTGIELLLEILPLKVFAWGVDDCPEGYWRLMSAEPWLVTLKLEGNKPTAIVGLEISNSPKFIFAETCTVLVENTQWMFRDGDRRICELEAT